MKKLFFIHLICGLVYATGAVWSIISFVLHVAKDTPFNWFPVALVIIGVLGAIINMVSELKKRKIF